MDWSLYCSQCSATASPDGLRTVCEACGSPWLVKYDRRVTPAEMAALASRPHNMWRYREFLPLSGNEEPVSLGEEKPRSEGHDEQAWSQNRRSDILYQGEY